MSENNNLLSAEESREVPRRPWKRRKTYDADDLGVARVEVEPSAVVQTT
jgi:hypothetical protein